ncbi:MAG: ATP synthase F1 subunit delta [Chitinispirillaceae bacterium]|nr:ATP synthase F1 subunit delta [Chitinispirillaceae bacterium]
MTTMKSAGLLAREYARSLDALFSDERSAVMAHLRALHEKTANEAGFQIFLEHPAITADEKLASLESMAPRRFSPLVDRVVADVIRRRMTFLFSAIAEEMQRLSDRAAGVHPVEVTSAAPLSGQQRTMLTESLKAYCGGNVRVHFAEDPSLMAGFSIRTADTVLDNSIRTGLGHIRRRLEAVSST